MILTKRFRSLTAHASTSASPIRHGHPTSTCIFLFRFFRPPANSLFCLLSKSQAVTVQHYPYHDDDTLIQCINTHGLAARSTRFGLVAELVSCKVRRRSVHEQFERRRRHGRTRRTSSGRSTKITALPPYIQQRATHGKTKPARAS